MNPDMYDAYLSVGRNDSTEDVGSTVENNIEGEGVVVEDIGRFVMNTLSSVGIAVEDEFTVEAINSGADYINAFARPVDTDDVEDTVQEEAVQEEVVVEEEEEIESEEVVVEEQQEDLSEFIITTIKDAARIKQSSTEEKIDVVAEDKDPEEVSKEQESSEESSEEEVVDESLNEFIRRTIIEQAKSAITATEERYEKETNSIFVNVKNKRERKKSIAKVNQEKKQAITAIEERQEEITESDTITDTMKQLELADTEYDPEQGNEEFQSSQRALKKELKQSIKAMFEEEQRNIRRVAEMSAGGGSVAKQFAEGGTMDGDLNVSGKILSGGIDLSSLFNGGSGGSIQPGDNISLLNNDIGYIQLSSVEAAGYVESGDDISLLNNDVGYITTAKLGADGLDQYYSEFAYTSAGLTQIEYWESASKSTKYFTKDLTYTAGNLTQVVLTNNITLSTETKDISYDGSGNLINITKS